MERMQRLAGPRDLQPHELTASEIERGEKLPDYIVPMRARERTPEQQERYRELEARVADLERRLRAAYPDPGTYSPDKLADIWQQVENDMIRIAADAREFADQYRQFNVGASLLGIRSCEPGENPWVILFDANTKPETVTGPVRKYCAELYISDRIDPEKPEMGLPREKIEKAVALFIVGEPQMDNDSRQSQITLTCCKLCRDRLWEMSQRGGGMNADAAISTDMPVVSADARNIGLRKLQQVKDLHRFHRELPPGYAEIE